MCANNSWGTNATVIERHCCPDMEFLMLKCRLFCLPREFPVVLITAMYVHPQANAKLAMGKLPDAISRQ